MVVTFKELLWFVTEMSLAVFGTIELKTGSQVFVLNSGQTFELHCEIQWSERHRKVTDLAVYFLKQQGPDQIKVNIVDEILHPFQDEGRMKITWYLKDTASLLMVLSISNMSHEDSGNYTCVVEDQISSMKASRITHHLFVRAVPWMIDMSLSYTLNSILKPIMANLSTVFYDHTILRHRIKNLQRINRSQEKNIDKRWSDAHASTSRLIKRFAMQQPIIIKKNKNKSSASGSSNSLGKLRFLSRFPTRIYCSSHGGYPIPEISIYFKEKLISKNIYRRSSDDNKLSLSSDKLNSSIHYNDSSTNPPPCHPINISTIIPQQSKHSREENESYSETKIIFHGKTGYKVVETQVTTISTALSLTPDDDGSIITCHVTVPGLKSNVTKRQIVVLHPPIVVCNSAEVSEDDKESVIGCLIRARPDLSSVYWHETPSHEKGNETCLDKNYENVQTPCNPSSVQDKSELFSPEGMYNTIRVLENGSLLAQLHLKSPQKYHFKKFYLTAENLLGSQTSSAEFIKKDFENEDCIAP